MGRAVGGITTHESSSTAPSSVSTAASTADCAIGGATCQRSWRHRQLTALTVSRYTCGAACVDHAVSRTTSFATCCADGGAVSLNISCTSSCVVPAAPSGGAGSRAVSCTVGCTASQLSAAPSCAVSHTVGRASCCSASDAVNSTVSCAGNQMISNTVNCAVGHVIGHATDHAIGRFVSAVLSTASAMMPSAVLSPAPLWAQSPPSPSLLPPPLPTPPRRLRHWLCRRPRRQPHCRPCCPLYRQRCCLLYRQLRLASCTGSCAISDADHAVTLSRDAGRGRVGGCVCDGVD